MCQTFTILVLLLSACNPSHAARKFISKPNGRLDAETAAAESLAETVQKESTLTGFDWSRPSCDVTSLEPSSLSTAMEWKKSGAGNMGGVYFLGLKNPGCNLVVKPQLDLHDVYASELASALSVPVAKTKALVSGTDEFENLISSFETHGLKEDFMTLVHSGSGFVQIMAVAEGKDVVDLTESTVGWETCNYCLRQKILSQVMQALKVSSESELPAAVAAEMAKDGHHHYAKYHELCKMMWTSLSTNNPELIEKFWPGKDSPPRWCPKAWRHSGDAFTEQAVGYFEEHHEDAIMALGTEFARHIYDFKNYETECPDDKEPTPEAVIAAREELRTAFTSPSTLADMAALSAYESFINENDGMNAIGQVTANYHNVFFSPQHATGIDIAVGGALEHGRISTSVSPEDTGIAFAYEDVKAAARITSCGSATEMADLASKTFAHHMARPYANADREFGIVSYVDCARKRGNVLPITNMTDAAVLILKAWPSAMKSIFAQSEKAIAATSQKLAQLNGPLTQAIEDWLRYHSRQVQEAFQAGEAECHSNTSDTSANTH